MDGKIILAGVFDLECLERGKVLWRDRFKNGITDAGLSTGLSAMFTAAWYLGIIDSVGFTGLAAGDTMASHGGWLECQTYSEANRPTWSKTVSGSVVTNASSLATFTMTANKTIKGLFLCDENTKGGGTGNLWCTGLDGAGRLVTTGQLLRARYTCTATGG